MRHRGGSRSAAALAIAVCAGHAAATWSIILIDTRTGEVGAASATCLTGFDLRAFTPVLLTGVGAATAQSFVDSSQQNRTLIRDRLAAGIDPAAILAELSTFDTGHQTRQYGIVDVFGRASTFSGTGAGAWAGGQTGSFEYTYQGQTGTIVYAIQGNVLTGEPVVLAAVDAARNTPGDLPERLMAAMEAARAMGGDGRCSCSPGNPTGCGAPPPSFTKSAHIAYMLIARASDRDASHGAYRAGSTPWAVEAADLTTDGLADLVITNSNSTNISVLRNSTLPGTGVAAFGAATHTPMLLSPRALALADLTRDGPLDAVVGQFGSNIVSVLPGFPGGTWGTRRDSPVGTGPQSLAVADFDALHGPDVAVANTTGDSVTILLNNGAGVLGSPQTFLIGDEPRSIAAADIDGDGDADLAVALRTESRIATLVNSGAGVFSLGASIATPALPTAIDAADFDNDGDDDLAVAVQSPPATISIFRRNGGAFEATNIALPATPAELRAGDVTGDGVADLVVPLLSGSQFVVVTRTVGDVFSVSPYGMGAPGFTVTPRRPALADIDGDGDLDAAFATSQPGGVFTIQNRGGGEFNSGCGTGFGDYFMTFNIANQQAADPDPVFQLRDRFDPWRAALEDRPDAVQTAVSVPMNLVADGASDGVVRITLRDWRGQSATHSIESVTVEHGPGSAGALLVGAPVALGNGVYDIPVTSTGLVGVDRLVITADDGLRPVTLMPEPSVEVHPCPADFSGDGFVNGVDFDLFVGAFEAGDAAADFNADGFVSGADFDDFVLRFEQGC